MLWQEMECRVGSGGCAEAARQIRRWAPYEAYASKNRGKALETIICGCKLEVSDRHLKWIGRA